MKTALNRLADSLRLFLSSAWLAYVGLFTWTDPNSYIAIKIIGPLSEIAFFAYLGMAATGRGSVDFYLIGNAMQVTALNGIYGVTMVVGGERNSGTLVYLVGSPASRLAALFGRTLFQVLDGMLTVVIGFLWAALFGLDLSQANFPVLALAIIITTISTCGLGLLLGSWSLRVLNVMFINNTLYFLLLVFSGANLPLDQMPAWMRLISAGLPLTRGIQAARLLVAGASLAQVMPLLAGEFAVGLAYALLGYALFRQLEVQARRAGTLEAV